MLSCRLSLTIDYVPDRLVETVAVWLCDGFVDVLVGGFKASDKRGQSN